MIFDEPRVANAPSTINHTPHHHYHNQRLRPTRGYDMNILCQSFSMIFNFETIKYAKLQDETNEKAAHSVINYS
jgi:hypothetical protein